MTKKISKKSLSATGWLPNYHGAWAMISVPVILGIILSGFKTVHWLLLASWWIGYFAFFAASLWLRTHRKAKLFPPVKVYGLALIVFAIGLGISAPYLIWWVMVYLPLVVITIWASTHRQDRSLLNNAVTVIAACLTLPVAYDLGINGVCFSLTGVDGVWGSGWLASTICATPSHQLIALKVVDWSVVWMITLLVFGYFMGAVFYVKTNVRERRSDIYLWLSVIFHLVFTLMALVMAKQGVVVWAHACLWVVLSLRSLAIPLYGRKQHWLSTKQIGMGEVMFSILVFITLLNEGAGR
ncbi:MAG: hypothetical protein CSA50_01555 [Gammaproteobacteria bacterium]|nr:MAG: hypothetical protein CSA50_01555 [Gammaproteobacteria bacterium]